MEIASPIQTELNGISATDWSATPVNVQQLFWGQTEASASGQYRPRPGPSGLFKNNLGAEMADVLAQDGELDIDTLLETFLDFWRRQH